MEEEKDQDRISWVINQKKIKSPLMTRLSSPELVPKSYSSTKPDNLLIRKASCGSRSRSLMPELGHKRIKKLHNTILTSSRVFESHLPAISKLKGCSQPSRRLPLLDRIGLPSQGSPSLLKRMSNPDETVIRDPQVNIGQATPKRSPQFLRLGGIRGIQ